MSECKFAEGWKNQEGWLVMSNGELVCLDWDEYCTECRVDDSRDWTFTVSTRQRDPTIPDTEAHVVLAPSKDMKKKYPRS